MKITFWNFSRLIVCISISISCIGQTVGTIYNSDEASHNLTLLSPVNSNSTYLIDNCGHIYNHWTSQYKLGLASYLDADGNLYRGGLINSQVFNSGAGKGGVIEKFNWDGQLEWQFELANDSMHLHHDFEVLSNGNLLVIAWAYNSYEDILALGRDSSRSSRNGFFSERIMEINPLNGFEIIWQWDALDHSIQDRDNKYVNYGAIQDNPQRLDINLNEPTNLSPPVDWLHINSIDYNADLDQILLSCNAIDELIIIDHSTTMSEASGSTGGLGGMGGDILFRWGNATNYIEAGNPVRQLFKQHDANWILENGFYTDRILLFNNGHRENDINFSTVDEIQLNRINTYNYGYQQNALDQSKDIIWRYNESGLSNLYSKRMSGARRKPNNVTLISESDYGRIFEIDREGNILWSYINPVASGIIFSQGDQAIGNTIFKSESYSPAYFNAGVELMTDYSLIQLDDAEDCQLYNISSISNKAPNTFNYTLDHKILILDNPELSNAQLELYSVMGDNLISQHLLEDRTYIDLSLLPSGIYIIYIKARTMQNPTCFKIYIN